MASIQYGGLLKPLSKGELTVYVSSLQSGGRRVRASRKFLLISSGVYLRDRSVAFQMGPFPRGTNNIGEFLAVVHALALIEQQGLEGMVVYSDSAIALSWVRRGRCKTLLERTPETAQLFALIERAERWLATHRTTAPLYKWDTVRWGEIPADYGRKG